MRSARAGWVLVACALVAGASLAEAQTSPEVTTTVYVMNKVAEPSALSPDEQQGRKLFVQRCALCHNPLGQPSGVTSGPWLDRTTVAQRGEERLRSTILVGIRRMPGWQHTLQPVQVDQLIGYLKTVTPEQRPESVRGARGPGVDDDLLR
jgi:mono/diheme cytochrome c family protein